MAASLQNSFQLTVDSSTASDLFGVLKNCSIIKDMKLSKIKDCAKEAFSSFKDVGQDALKGDFDANKIIDCSKKIFRLAARITPLLCAIGMVAFVIATPYIGPGALVGITALAAIGKVASNYNKNIDNKALASQAIQGRIDQFHRVKDDKTIKIQGLLEERSEKGNCLAEKNRSKIVESNKIQELKENVAFAKAEKNSSPHNDPLLDDVIEDYEREIKESETVLAALTEDIENFTLEIKTLEEEIQEESQKEYPLEAGASRAIQFRALEKKIDEKVNGASDLGEIEEITKLIREKYEYLKKDFEEENNDYSLSEVKYLNMRVSIKTTKEINMVIRKIQDRQIATANAAAPSVEEAL